MPHDLATGETVPWTCHRSIELSGCMVRGARVFVAAEPRVSWGRSRWRSSYSTSVGNGFAASATKDASDLPGGPAAWTPRGSFTASNPILPSDIIGIGDAGQIVSAVQATGTFMTTKPKRETHHLTRYRSKPCPVMSCRRPVNGLLSRLPAGVKTSGLGSCLCQVQSNSATRTRRRTF